MNQNVIRGLLGAGIVIICLIVGAGILAEQPSETENISGIQVFTSASALSAYLDNMPQADNGYTTGFMGMDGNVRVVSEEAAMDSAMPPAPVPAQLPQALKGESSGSGEADEYSSTNVQVSGVDEADFIKNDGKYIYLVSGGRLVIVDAYPPLGAGIVSDTPLTGTPSNLFLSKDRLAVFSSVRETAFIQPEGSAAPVPYTRDVTHVYVYDVSDRKEPKIVRDLTVSGTYSDGRMKGTDVFLFTRESLSRYGDYLQMPEVRDGDTLIAQPPVSVPDMVGYSWQFTTVTSFDIRDGTVTDTESFLLGYGTTLYVSEDNIYIAYEWQPYSRGVWGGFNEPPADTREQSVLHRFSVEKGDISYAATGTFPGRLLNQFSLDEYKGNLRVATTVDDWTRDTRVQYNNVYVLGPDLAIMGKLEYIAPDERIYAARFIGDRLYLVTFKQMDPFFVIDLSDPKRPAVLGELKLPGYSDYLHPYDATHIIGIGKETVANEWGGFTTGGLKMTLFDVADVNNPVEVDTVEIGLPGTDSEALHDHKAFLFDASRGILVLPVHEIVKVPVTGKSYDAYSTKYWQGAYVYGLTPETGFVLKGTVTHNADPQSGYYWGAPDSVLRSLYMDDVLYTVSRTKLVISGLEHPEMVYGTLTLPDGGYSDNRYDGGPWPVSDVMIE